MLSDCFGKSRQRSSRMYHGEPAIRNVSEPYLPVPQPQVQRRRKRKTTTQLATKHEIQIIRTFIHKLYRR